ncbi:hypothetical protein MPER_07304 [Moniliophthora perniciosa FA553]|nr:hypothetical protein MPER_07304 [Moniliophthora perniciosa FA553]
MRQRSPRNNTRKANYIESVSGDGPLSHPGLSEGMTTAKKEYITHIDTFTCIGGVNVPLLLRATRTSLLEMAEMCGGNCLVDEQWKCTISGPKSRPRGTYKIQIHYSAAATKSSKSDPHKPVALDAAKSVPGLMTIMERQE